MCDSFVKIDDAFSGLSSSVLTVPQLTIIRPQLHGLLSTEVFPITNSINISKGSLAFFRALKMMCNKPCPGLFSFNSTLFPDDESNACETAVSCRGYSDLRGLWPCGRFSPFFSPHSLLFTCMSGHIQIK